MKNKLEKYNCPLGLTLGVIGGKYKVMIIWFLYQNKVLRYNELQKTIKGITPKILTAKGESLIPILLEMKKWGEKYKSNT